MRRPTLIPLVLSLLPALCLAVVIDRIVVVVGTQVITESELDLTIRLTALMNQKPLDFSPEIRRAAAERLIVKKFIVKELDFSKFPRPSLTEVDPLIESFVQSAYHGDRAAFAAALQAYGITGDEFQAYRLWLLTFFRFIDFRFRPGIQVSDQDVDEYFKTKILSLAQQANPGKPVSIDEYHDRIESILLAQREDQQLEVWLKDQRTRTKVEYRDATLKPDVAQALVPAVSRLVSTPVQAQKEEPPK